MSRINCPVIVSLACGFALVLAACSSQAAPSAGAPSAATASNAPSAVTASNAPSAMTASNAPSANVPSGSGLIYYLAPELSDEFQVAVNGLMLKDGTSLGYTVRSLNANNVATTQVNQLDDIIGQHPKAVIIAAVDSSTVITGVEKARAAGIKVLVFDRFITTTPIDFTSVTGTVKLGMISADEVGRLLIQKLGSPSGTVLEIMGDLGDQYTVTIDQGFKQEMAQKFPNVKIITKDSPGWTLEAAAAAVEDQLTAKHHLDLIFLHGDFRAESVIAALQSKAVAKNDILLVGTDGAPTGLAAIRAGWMTETVQQPAVEQAWGLWQNMADVLANKTFTPGTVDVKALQAEMKIESWGPALYLPGSVIDAKNVGDPNLWGNLK